MTSVNNQICDIMYPLAEIFATILLGFQDIHHWCGDRVTGMHLKALEKAKTDSQAILQVIQQAN